MKKRIVIAILAVLLTVSAHAQTTDSGKYVPNPNEEIYGTWTNKMDPIPHMLIVTAATRKVFLNTTDSDPMEESTFFIDSKWTDASGNLCYKTFGTNTAGFYQGLRWQGLERINKAGTVKESQTLLIGHNDFDPGKYPAELDPKNPTYKIYYRSAG